MAPTELQNSCNPGAVISTVWKGTPRGLYVVSGFRRTYSWTVVVQAFGLFKLYVVSGFSRTVTSPPEGGHYVQVEPPHLVWGTPFRAGRRLAEDYGSAKTKTLGALPCISSGATRELELATSDGPVITATYCLPSTAYEIG